MEDSSRKKTGSVWEPRSRRRSWCCSFAVPPSSPDNFVISRSRTPRNKSESVAKPNISVPNSPQSSKSGLGLVGRIDPRRILSPGRVSPIDSDQNVEGLAQEMGTENSAVIDSIIQPRVESFRAPKEKYRDPPASLSRTGSIAGYDKKDVFDVRLNLRGKNGGCLVLELNSEALCANSEVFSELIVKHKKDLASNGSPSRSKLCRIEVPEVDNLGVFRDTIELMFEDDISKWLVKVGVYRAIDILEVSAGIMFTKCVASCLNYLEAVPWTEEEEEKIRNLFLKVKFDDATSRDVMARLRSLDSVTSRQCVARQLVWSISTCTNSVARNELKCLVKALLCKSSVYEKHHLDLSKEDLYAVFHTCIASLVSLLKGSSDGVCPERGLKNITPKPLIEQIAVEVDNINWLLEILLDWQMAEEFVNTWADQKELIRMHENTSPMVRYELSRVSAYLFIAMGMRKLNCRSESRSGLLQAWFGPMLLDFSWLQRCKKGLDMKLLEEAMGQVLLTLPMKQQHLLFMDWCRFFSKRGTECPNLSKSFQIWWRRSFLRGSETYSIESR
ncbi:BTB/POZ domain-containing protein At2g13690-like [Cucurbita maxima]|uniref:BTB/POZ domain-containing protein At2g13690-like n=1 Tax=Cucurbita maxima TaxID=3661 RepID=A0A6J1KPH6_CUCMA|nr:BTB/POZ domain-containing protein At2g13690-like [Cucurbita maxima]